MITYTPHISDDRRTALETISADCETFRDAAIFKTGSISLAAMAYLRELVTQFQPNIVIEIGTFIGKSTHCFLDAPSVKHVYTCDLHNDCLQSDDRLTCHPYMTSTAMLARLLQHGLIADLFFFDGRLSPSDVPLILRLSRWKTVYLFDDYHENPPGEQFQYGKGVFNVALLEPFLREHTFLGPPEHVDDLDGFTTIAGLVPKELV